MLIRLLGCLVAVAVLSAACNVDAEPLVDDAPAARTADEFDDEGEFDAEEFDDDFADGGPDDEFEDEASDDDSDDSDAARDAAEDSTGTSRPGGQVDLSLQRDDIDCSDEGLGSDATVFFVVAHVVVDGNLGAVCFGEQDPTLVSAWETLAAITPPGQLRDLGLFGGFTAGIETGGTTLAFVNALDDDGTLFQMSVNLDEATNDPDELMLTMAHEFSHVFTATTPQLDRFIEPEDCDTYDNGDGCYKPGSVMAEWIELFWGNGLIDEIDPNEEATVDSGEARCSINPSFFGPYAASSPEEDFAESFSAYVFDVAADTDEQEAKLAWIDSQPGLAEFRDRAIEADLGPLENNFERCG